MLTLTLSSLKMQIMYRVREYGSLTAQEVWNRQEGRGLPQSSTELGNFNFRGKTVSKFPVDAGFLCKRAPVTAASNEGQRCNSSIVRLIRRRNYPYNKNQQDALFTFNLFQ